MASLKRKTSFITQNISIYGGVHLYKYVIQKKAPMTMVHTSCCETVAYSAGYTGAGHVAKRFEKPGKGA